MAGSFYRQNGSDQQPVSKMKPETGFHDLSSIKIPSRPGKPGRAALVTGVLSLQAHGSCAQPRKDIGCTLKVEGWGGLSPGGPSG